MQSDEEQRGTRRRRLLYIVVVLGVALLIVGIALLMTEVALLRFFDDSEFSGVECGGPLNNPGWRTGSPCHGAVNRQTAIAWVAVINGIGLTVTAVFLNMQARRKATQPT
jgi:hypothetical protein